MPADTYSLVLTRAQLLIVLKTLQAATEMWQALVVAEVKDIETLLTTLTEVESDNAR